MPAYNLPLSHCIPPGAPNQEPEGISIRQLSNSRPASFGNVPDSLGKNSMPSIIRTIRAYQPDFATQCRRFRHSPVRVTKAPLILAGISPGPRRPSRAPSTLRSVELIHGDLGQKLLIFLRGLTPDVPAPISRWSSAPRVQEPQGALPHEALGPAACRGTISLPVFAASCE